MTARGPIESNAGCPRPALVAALVLAATVSGCAKPSLIPNTKVKDTALNREILTVVEKYRRSMERLDAAAVLALVHPTYQDHSGTPEPSDDLDYNGLKELLRTRFKKAAKIRYHIEYLDVRTKGREAEVDGYLDATFVYREPKANAKWGRLTRHNRFRLLKEGSAWRFVGGL